MKRMIETIHREKHYSILGNELKWSNRGLKAFVGIVSLFVGVFFIIKGIGFYKMGIPFFENKELLLGISIWVIGLFVSQSNIILYREENKVSTKFLEKWKRDYGWGQSLVIEDDLAYRYVKMKRITIFIFFFALLFSISQIIIGILFVWGVFFFMLVKSVELMREYNEIGKSKLILLKKPFWIGETISFTFQNHCLDKKYKLMYASLIFIKEKIVYKSDGDGGTSKSVDFQLLHKELKIFPLDNGECMMTFDLGSELPENNLSVTPASYWMLDIEASNGDDSFKTSFLLPIYKK